MASMKLVFGLLLVAFLAYVQAELDIDQLEKDLQNSEWTDEPVDMDDSDEETGRIGTKKQRCSCMDHSTCGCCIKPRIFGMKFRGCLNATMFTTETKDVELVEVVANIFEQQVAQYNFTVLPINKMCKAMPGMKSLNICLYNNNTMSAEKGFVSCSSMDILVKETPAAQLKFSCLQFKDDQVSFVDNKDVGREAWVSMKVKSPLKFVVDFFNKNNKLE